MAKESTLGFEAYKKCVGARAPRIEESKGALGLRNLNKDQLRCFLLQQKQEEIGGSRAVLDLDNWYDCRIQYPPDPGVIIAKALADLGFAKVGTDPTRPGSYFDQIAADLEDAAGTANPGPLVELLRMVSSLPRQDSLDRAQWESLRNQVVTVGLPMAEKYIKKAIPGAEEAVQDARTLILNLVDQAVATADYIAEYRAVRQEAASRIFSMDRRERIEDAYRTQYGLPAGTRPASSTIAAWCRVGSSRAAASNNPYAYLSAPDGTDGEAVARQSAYAAALAVAKTAATNLKKQLKDDWRKFFGLSGTIGAWVLAYSRNDVHPTAFDRKGAHRDYIDRNGYPGWGSTSIMRYIGAAANEGGDSYDLFQDAGEGTLAAAQPTVTVWDRKNFGMLLPAAKGEKPLRERVWWPAYDMNSEAKVDYGDRSMLLQKSTAFMWAGYMQGKAGLKQEDWFGKPTRVRLIASPKLTDGYAEDVWAVWKFWEAYVESARPFLGKFKKWAFLRDEVFAPRVDDFFAILDNPKASAALSKMSWEARIVYILEDSPTGTPPSARKRAPSPCPTSDLSCLPCAAIKGRLPIGAKVIDIPMVIEFTGSSPLASGEYKAWAQRLADNGYPGYYIDCLAREATFKSKASGKTLQLAGGPYDVPTQGLTAPYTATLDFLPPPPVPEIAGMTRPLMIEPVMGKKR